MTNWSTGRHLDVDEHVRILRELDIEAARPFFHYVSMKHKFAQPVHPATGLAVESDEVILCALHKARIESPRGYFTREEIDKSIVWLMTHRYKVPG